MPLLLSVLGGLSSAAWLAYGFIANDNFVVFPNIIGILLSLVQLYFKFKYHHHKPVFLISVKESDNLDILVL
jgi:uncharacterized protein with PQ loop repeat